MSASKGSLAAVVGVSVLVLITVMLLLSLRRPQPPPSRAAEPQAEAPAPAAAPPTEPAPSPTPRAEPRRPAPAEPSAPSAAAATPTPGDAGPARAAADGGASRAEVATAGPAGAPTPGAHVAPPALPRRIQEEKDPARRAELMRMHRLASARVRASILRRRAQLLESALGRSSRDGSWTPEQQARARKDLEELRGAIKTAEENVKQAEKKVREGTGP